MRPIAKVIACVAVLSVSLPVVATAAPRQPSGKRDGWRNVPPAPGPEPKAPAAKISRAELPNGLTILVHERHDVPFVVVRALVDAGDSTQPTAQPGLASFTADMLLSGTEKRDALKLADDIGALGADVAIRCGSEEAHADLSTLKATLPQAMQILGEIVVEPAFPIAEIERARARRQSQILQHSDDPAQVIRDVIPAVLYGVGHPYAAPRLGTKESIAKLTRDDLVRFYRGRYRPTVAALIFVGDVTIDEARSLAERSPFASWRGDRIAPIVGGSPAQPLPRGIVVVDKPGAPQSQVGMVMLTVPRTHPDFVPLSIAISTFGGIFSSRLNLNLREERGYTYGAFSAIGWHRGPSMIVARGGIRTDVTVPAIEEFRHELRRLVDQPPSDAEIALSKAQMVHGVVGAFETMHATAGAISEIFVYGLPLDYFERFSREVEAVDREKVKQAIKTHIHPERAAVIVVGDRAKVIPELQIEDRDALGRAVKPELRAP